MKLTPPEERAARLPHIKQDDENWVFAPVSKVTDEIRSAQREATSYRDERWQQWRKRLLECWANDHRATMTALLEGGPELEQPPFGS